MKNQVRSLNKEESEKYIELVKNGNKDDMFSFGYQLGSQSIEKVIVEEVPTEIMMCELECIVMPNGEVMCNGRTIGWFEDLKNYLKIRVSN